MSTMSLVRKCPLCNNSRGRLLFTQTLVHSNNGNLSAPNSKLPEKFDVVSCCQCGFLFHDMNGSQELYDNYYKTMSKYENDAVQAGSGMQPWDYDRLYQTAYVVKKYIKPSYKVLDIASGGGGVVRILDDEGYNSLYSLEISTELVNRLNENTGVKAHVGSLTGNLPSIYREHSFNIVILTHVLEHIYDLKEAIKNISKIISPDGVVYVEVPNASEYGKNCIRPFHYFSEEHINHFTKRTIDLAFSNFGYVSIEHGEKLIRVSETDYYPVIYSVYKPSVDCGMNKLKDYVRISKERENIYQFADLQKNQQPLAIWGIGAYAKRLLAASDLSKCNIKHLIDIDPKLQGSEMLGVKISSPEVLYEFDGDILVTSAIFYSDILNKIRGMGLKNHVTLIK